MAKVTRSRDGVANPAVVHADEVFVDDGVTRVSDDAARSLGDQLAARFAPLMDRLAND